MIFSEGTYVEREFLAVVLAGFGHELTPLSSGQSDVPAAKALLPVGNRSMLDITLSWIDQAGIREVLLICPPSHRAPISHYLDSQMTLKEIRVDLQVSDEPKDMDFVILPCDFVASSSLPLFSILNRFRADASSDGCLITACFYSTDHSDKTSLPADWSPSNSVTPIVWDPISDTLLHVDTADDAEKNSDELQLRMALLNRYPRTRLSPEYQDCHVYVCQHAVINLLEEKDAFDSFREDFFPWICRLHYQRNKRDRFASALSSLGSSCSQTLAKRHSTAVSPKTSSTALEEEAKMSDLTDHATDILSSMLRVTLYLHDVASGMAIRANTLKNFYNANQSVLSPVVTAASSSSIQAPNQVSSDSLVGESTLIGERSTIKRSIIGRHCNIGKSVRITGSVIMDHCIIRDFAKVDGSILSQNTVIGIKANVSHCVSQDGYEVAEEDNVKNERLEVSNWAENAGLESNDDSGEADKESDEEDGSTDSTDSSA